jgi:capsular polysaccharide biosynthesis protein
VSPTAHSTNLEATRYGPDGATDLNQAARRIGQHWRLMLLILVLTVGLVAVAGRESTPTYTASARLILDTQDPESRAEAAGIADGAKAIVTSASQVAAALREAHVAQRDPTKVAEHVSLRALGSSAVLQLSVRDRDPRVAAAIANGLARRLIATRLEITEGEAERVLTDLERRLEDVNRRIALLNARIDTLTVAVAQAPTAERANAVRGKRDEAARARDFLAQQRVVLESQRVDLFAAAALRPKPAIIGRARLPDRADSSRRAADLVLAAIFALVVGVAYVGLIETLRPTLVGGDAIAREFGVPLLGTIRENAGDARVLADAGDVAMRLRLAAKAAGLRDVSLLSVGRVDVASIHERLTAAAAVSRGAGRDEGHAEDAAEQPREAVRAETAASATAAPTRQVQTPRGALRIRPFGAQNPSLHNGATTGLALVSRSKVNKAQLADAAHLLAVSPFPVLGLITHESQRDSTRGRTSRGTDAGRSAESWPGDSRHASNAMAIFEKKLESLEPRGTTDGKSDR